MQEGFQIFAIFSIIEERSNLKCYVCVFNLWIFSKADSTEKQKLAEQEQQEAKQTISDLKANQKV